VAVLLCWGLFLLWTLTGLAALNAGRFRGGVRKLLLAPAVGIAAYVVVTYLVMRFGWAAGPVARPVGAGVLGAALVVLWRTRAAGRSAGAALARYGPFAAILAATFALTAWPLVRYGFDWIANGNDDMANYCLSATGFRAHGYHRVPTWDEMRHPADLTDALWPLYHDPKLLTENRCGVELTLALVSTWTGLSAQQAFMPVTVAFDLALVAATAGLVLGATRRRAAAVAAAGLLGVSSQTTYGVVQQLLAQVSGLALFCAALAMVVSPFRRLPRALVVRRAAVCGLVFSGLILVYPETVPFLVGACVLLGVRDLWRRRPVARHLWHAGAAVAAMAAAVPVYLYGTAYFLAHQAAQGVGSGEHTLEIFPYFMTPRGPALVCGLMPAYGEVPEPRQTASLVAGCAFLAAGVWLAWRQFRTAGRPFAAVVLVMAAAGVMLYRQNAAFGLFKLSMFVQPFLWATVAVWVTRRRRAIGLAAVCVLGTAGLNARTQFWYAKQSTGHDARVDLPAVTQQRVMSEYHARIVPRIAAERPSRVLLATENNVLQKLLAAEISRVPTSLATMTLYDWMLEVDHTGARAPEAPDCPGSVPVRAAPRAAAPEPWLLDPDTGARRHRLMHVPDAWDGPPESVRLLAGGGKLSVFNRYHYPETERALVYEPLTAVRNFAMFRDATGARQLYLGMDHIEEVAIHRLEPDPFFRGRTLSGVGRAIVVDVLNPTPRVRVLVSQIASFRPDLDHREVSPAEVIGARRVPLGAVGDGAARLVSPPVEPQAVGSAHLIEVDFNRELICAPNHLTGLERAWGTHLPRDRRRLSGHMRDLSILSEEDYAAFRPPHRVERFPDDLAHPHLEFSGLYEDGWANRAFKIRLTQPTPGGELVYRGQIPITPASAGTTTELTVLIDGLVVKTVALAPGPFEVRAPAGPAAGPRWVECRFGATFRLPNGDDRRMSANVEAIGFEAPDPARPRPPERSDGSPAAFPGKAAGGDPNGWVGQAGGAQLWFAGSACDLVLRAHVPAADPAVKTEMIVLVGGAEVARRALPPGDAEVRVPVGAGEPGARRIECRFSATPAPPAPDARTPPAVLRGVGFEPGK
jgi:hypothetical protein